jgi:hypothetical protein
VPNIQIYLHENFHNLLRSLSIFPIFIFTPQKLENSLQKEKEFLLLGPNSLCRPNPPHEAGPHRPTLPAPLPVGPGALTAPPINHPPSARAPPVRIFSPKSPSRVHWRPLVIHCCCAPSCRPGTCRHCPRANASCAESSPCPLTRRVVASHRYALRKRHLPSLRHKLCGADCAHAPSSLPPRVI